MYSTLPYVISDKYNDGYCINWYLNFGTFNDKQLVMPVVSKCASSTLTNLYHKINNRHYDKSNLLQYDWNKFFSFSNYMEQNRINIDKLENRLFVAVIRDPIERLISSFRTVSHIHYLNISMYQYIDMINYTYKHCLKYSIDRHINNQFLYYEYNKVDMFVRIKDLDKFLGTLGFTDITKYNVNNIKVDIELFKRNTTLMKNLEPEYEIYNSIINDKNKLFE